MASPQAQLFPLGNSIPDAPATHPACKLYREICRLSPNYVQRYNLIKEVGESVLHLDILREVLIQYMMEHQNPKRVDWILDRFNQALPSDVGR